MLNDGFQPIAKKTPKTKDLTTCSKPQLSLLNQKIL